MGYIVSMKRQRRSRRAGATETFSVSVDSETKRALRQLADHKTSGAGAALTIDAIVMATAALTGATVVTGDPEDFEKLSAHFPKVAVLSA